MFLSFIRFDLLSVEHGNPISHEMWLYISVALLLRKKNSIHRISYIYLFSMEAKIWLT